MPNFNESLSFQRFRSKVDFQKQHSQIVVAALNKTFGYLRTHQQSERTICDVLTIDCNLFDMLDHPVTEYARIINYSKRKNAEHTLIELYNAFTTYIKELLKELYDGDRKKVIHKANETYKYSDIINFNTSYGYYN